MTGYDARIPDKVITPEKYEELDIKDWHEVCHNWDGNGAIAIRYIRPIFIME